MPMRLVLVLRPVDMLPESTEYNSSGMMQQAAYIENLLHSIDDTALGSALRHSLATFPSNLSLMCLVLLAWSLDQPHPSFVTLTAGQRIFCGSLSHRPRAVPRLAEPTHHHDRIWREVCRPQQQCSRQRSSCRPRIPEVSGVSVFSTHHRQWGCLQSYILGVGGGGIGSPGPGTVCEGLCRIGTMSGTPVCRQVFLCIQALLRSLLLCTTPPAR